VDARDRFTERNLRGQLPIRTDTSYEDEIETFEYHEMQQQLGFLKQRYPLLSGIEGLSLPMIASPELITCDNTAFIHTLADADRSGVVFTVPFYGSDEGLRGAVSAIILSSALKALLPGRDSSLVNVGHGYALGLGDGWQQKLSAEKVRAGRPDETLLYSEAVPVTSAIEDYPYAV